ncbi:hypothetical protein N8787_02815 [Opitutaceae bacterium]|nr:hypothetical protein [Opitutaceae bacterium]
MSTLSNQEKALHLGRPLMVIVPKENFTIIPPIKSIEMRILALGFSTVTEVGKWE